MSWRALGIALGLVCATTAFPQAFAADISAVTANPAPVNSEGIEVYAPPPVESFKLVNEARVGVFAHNWIHDEAAPVDVSVELLSSPVRLWNTTNPWIAWFFNPRFNIGGMINTTDHGTSYGFAGLTWRIPIYQKFFFEGEFGGAINDAPLHPVIGRVDMGCRLTFREFGGFGYQFTDNIDLIASIEHVSHATFCTNINPGLTQVGARIGYKF